MEHKGKGEEGRRREDIRHREVKRSKEDKYKKGETERGILPHNLKSETGRGQTNADRAAINPSY